MPVMVVIQTELSSSAEGGRIGSGVNQDIVDRPAGTAYELSFAASRPAVQAAQHAISRARLRVLYKGGRVDAVRSRDLGVKRAGEETAIVVMGRWHEDQDAGKIGQPNFHRVMVPRC